MSSFTQGEIRLAFISLFALVLLNVLLRAFVPDSDIVPEDAEGHATLENFDVAFDVPTFLTFGDAQAQAEGTTLMPDIFVAVVLYLFRNAASVIQFMLEVLVTAVEIVVWFFQFLAFQASLQVSAWQWVFDIAPSSTTVVLLVMWIPLGFLVFNFGAKVADIVKHLIPFT